jgi:hypothetical protein
MLRHALLFVVVVLAAPVYGQEVQLKLKFKEGEKFWVEDVTTTKQTVTTLGQAIMSEEKTTMLTSYTVKKVTADAIVLDMKIEDVQVKTEAGLGGELSKILEKTKNSAFTVTLAPDGKVTKFEGFAEVAKKLTGGDDAAAQLIKDLVNEEIFTKGIEQAFSFLPDKSVKKGDTWTRDTKYPGGPLGDFKASNTYTYNGKGDGGEEIAVKQSLQYVAPKGGVVAGLAKVVRGDLKGDQAGGTFIFDADKGRLVSASTAMRISGSLTLDIGGQQAQVDLVMDSKGTSKVHGKNPNKQ